MNTNINRNTEKEINLLGRLCSNMDFERMFETVYYTELIEVDGIQQKVLRYKNSDNNNEL